MAPAAPAAVAAAFDAAAARYDGSFGDDALALRLRERVWERIAFRLGGPSLLLDVGCGTGIDALHHARAGHRVVAADASEGMRAAARARADADPGAGARVDVRSLDAGAPASWEELSRHVGRGRVDLIYSNFGALNCVTDLRAFADGAAALLKPQGAAVLVVMPRVAPWELAAAPAHPRRAGRRLQRRPVATVEGTSFPVAYPTLRSLVRDMGARFRLEGCRPLGFLLPAPPSRWPRAVTAPLMALDGIAARIPVLRGMGDHVIVELRRRP